MKGDDIFSAGEQEKKGHGKRVSLKGKAGCATTYLLSSSIIKRSIRGGKGKGESRGKRVSEKRFKFLTFTSAGGGKKKKEGKRKTTEGEGRDGLGQSYFLSLFGKDTRGKGGGEKGAQERKRGEED